MDEILSVPSCDEKRMVMVVARARIMLMLLMLEMVVVKRAIVIGYSNYYQNKKKAWYR